MMLAYGTPQLEGYPGDAEDARGDLLVGLNLEQLHVLDVAYTIPYVHGKWGNPSQVAEFLYHVSRLRFDTETNVG